MSSVRSGMIGMEKNELNSDDFQLGLILPSKSTEKLLKISIMAEEDPYEIIIRAIDTLYKAHLNGPF